MAENMIPKGNYFLVGLSVGSLISVQFAPKSREKTREYITNKTREGNELARKKGLELRDRGEEAFERSKRIVAQTGGRIATAIDVGIHTYSRQKMTAHV